MFYNPKYVLQHKMRTKRYMPWQILLARLDVICFGNTTDASTKLTENNLQTASRIQFCNFLLIFQSYFSFFSFSRRTFIKTAFAIQYRSRYKYRSAVVAMNTRTNTPPSWKQFWDTYFAHPQSNYIEA